MSSPRSLPFWRSLLFVPATNPRFIDRAHERGADAIIVDLEDSIPASEKATARAGVSSAIDFLARRGCQVLVRVNNSDHLVADLERVVQPGLFAVDVPKVADGAQLRRIDELVAGLEQKAGLPIGGIRLKLVIESASALMSLQSIADFARENARVVAMTLGNEDLAAELGVEPSVVNLFHPCQQIVLAARSAGVLPLGYPGSVSDFRDLSGLRANIRRARTMGLVGSSCIHPSHVPILNEGFAPGAAEIAKAQRIVAAAEEAARQGIGAFDLDGHMIDEPIIQRARRLCEHAARAAQRK